MCYPDGAHGCLHPAGMMGREELMIRIAYLLIAVMLLAVGCAHGAAPAGKATPGGSQPTTPPAPADPPAVFTVDDLQRDSGKEPFTGQFGGLLFKQTVSAENLGCPPAAPVDEVPAQTISSPLIIDVKFLAPAFSITGGERVAVCGNHAISYAVRASGATGAHLQELSIARFSGATVVASEPVEAFHEVSVRGKPAVIIKGPPLPGAPRGDDPYRWRLLVKEEYGITLIEARWFTRDQLLNLAEKLS